MKPQNIKSIETDANSKRVFITSARCEDREQNFVRWESIGLSELWKNFDRQAVDMAILEYYADGLFHGGANKYSIAIRKIGKVAVRKLSTHRLYEKFVELQGAAKQYVVKSKPNFAHAETYVEHYTRGGVLHALMIAPLEDATRYKKPAAAADAFNALPSNMREVMLDPRVVEVSAPDETVIDLSGDFAAA